MCISMATKENLDIDYLEGIIRESWCKETSTDPEHWTEENPAWGQCAVTALVVNDYCSGKLVWAQAQAGDEGYSHYFNLIDGEEYDLSREQFPPGTIVPAGMDKKKGFPSTREYVLSYEKTVQRYEILKARVQDAIFTLIHQK